MYGMLTSAKMLSMPGDTIQPGSSQKYNAEYDIDDLQVS